MTQNLFVTGTPGSAGSACREERQVSGLNKKRKKTGLWLAGLKIFSKEFFSPNSDLKKEKNKWIAQNLFEAGANKKSCEKHWIQTNHQCEKIATFCLWPRSNFLRGLQVQIWTSKTFRQGAGYVWTSLGDLVDYGIFFEHGWEIFETIPWNLLHFVFSASMFQLCSWWLKNHTPQPGAGFRKCLHSEPGSNRSVGCGLICDIMWNSNFCTVVQPPKPRISTGQMVSSNP